MATTLTITMDLDNAAFADNGMVEELRTVLAMVAAEIETAHSGPSGAAGPILDTNGNRVGKWTVTY